MLKNRIIPTVLMRGQQAVKGIGFRSWRNIGNVRMTVRVHQMRNVDELVLLDISGNLPDTLLVRHISGDCFFPLTVGGGVRSVDDIVCLLANGADKVSLNSAAIDRPSLITEAARKVGSQSVVISMDVGSNGLLYAHNGQRNTGLEAVAWARRVQDLGAGELLLTSVERDGALGGYDLDLVRKVSAAVTIPVIAAGGAGSYRDLADGLDAGAHGVAAGALWAFTEATPPEAAQQLHAWGYNVRRPYVANCNPEKPVQGERIPAS